jgi:hypothetical protein
MVEQKIGCLTCRTEGKRLIVAIGVITAGTARFTAVLSALPGRWFQSGGPPTQ